MSDFVDLLNKEMYELKIADLEAKLAESENTIKTLIQDSKASKEFYKKQFNEQVWLCEELREQLAEKEKGIKQLKLDLGMFKSVNEFINSYGIEKAREVLLQTEKTKNQDKISFCIEKLEKVKKLFEERCRYDVEESEYAVVYEDDVDEIIDNQIKELKKEIE